jgi:hypothetical protein
VGTQTGPERAGKQEESAVGEDDIMVWQDVLELVLNKRPMNNVVCPWCYQPTLEVTRREKVTRVACNNKACRQFIEGSFGDSQYDQHDDSQPMKGTTVGVK